MTSAGVFALVALVVWALLFAKSLQGILRTPVLRRAPEAKGAVAGYVPARDEVEVIEDCVRAALAQPQLTDLVVIDDRSEDGTGPVLARIAVEQDRLQVQESRARQPGHCGKPSALQGGYEARPPTTEWVLFLDADVVLAPGALGGLLEAARAHEADLVTLIPTVTLGTALEKVVMPAVGALVLAHHPPARVSDPEDGKAFANGQVILVRREVYERVGGHRAVILEVLEDVALARLVKAAGGRLLVADGRHLATTRMYASWAELAEGWIKNLFLLMDARLSVALGWAAASVVLGSLGWAAALVERGPLGLACGLMIVSMQATLRYMGGASPWFAPLAPVGAVVAAGLLLVSAWRHRAGGVTWKGRRYPGSR